MSWICIDWGIFDSAIAMENVRIPRIKSVIKRKKVETTSDHMRF